MKEVMQATTIKYLFLNIHMTKNIQVQIIVLKCNFISANCLHPNNTKLSCPSQEEIQFITNITLWEKKSPQVLGNKQAKHAKTSNKIELGIKQPLRKSNFTP